MSRRIDTGALCLLRAHATDDGLCLAAQAARGVSCDTHAAASSELSASPDAARLQRRAAIHRQQGDKRPPGWWWVEHEMELRAELRERQSPAAAEERILDRFQEAIESVVSVDLTGSQAEEEKLIHDIISRLEREDEEENVDPGRVAAFASHHARHRIEQRDQL
jgi:hypothetical protein